MKIWLFTHIEGFLNTLVNHLETLRCRFAICPNCGRNRYTGEPCVK